MWELYDCAPAAAPVMECMSPTACLSIQGTMLDELDEDVEGTSARLAAAQKRINHVLAKAGMKGQMCIILFLIAVGGLPGALHCALWHVRCSMGCLATQICLPHKLAHISPLQC